MATKILYIGRPPAIFIAAALEFAREEHLRKREAIVSDGPEVEIIKLLRRFPQGDPACDGAEVRLIKKFFRAKR